MLAGFRGVEGPEEHVDRDHPPSYVIPCTVDSLLTHTSHTPYSLIPHRILNIPTWFAGISDT